MEKKCLEIVAALRHQPAEALAERFEDFWAGMERPLNDSRWYLKNLHHILRKNTEPGRLAEISKLLNRTNPGPGGYHVNAGMPSFSGGSTGGSSDVRIHYGAGVNTAETVPLAWLTQAVGSVEKPFTLTFGNLNPYLTYRIRVVYPTWCLSTVSLTADSKFKIHPLRRYEQPVQVFTVPRRAISDGKITFSWTCGRGEAGAQVAEVWLYPEKSSQVKYEPDWLE